MVLDAQNASREPDLVPVRHGRMAVSAFTFYRGAAKLMAVDLGCTADAGLWVQLCGDAHLLNFGVFASPERSLVFDINDFDETLPGPFEYDLKRLATSFVVAARHNGFDDDLAAARTCARTYSETMRALAGLPTLDVWYAHLPVDQVTRLLRESPEKGMRRQAAGVDRVVRKARRRDSLSALEKLTEVVDGQYRIVADPPIVVPLRDVPAFGSIDPDVLAAAVSREFAAYKSSLGDDRRRLVERFRLVDSARKVVGVGSVGLRAFIVLLEGRDESDPLFLQLKEAVGSVYEDEVSPSVYGHHGERVVQGQRMMQATSDVFLGWSEGVDPTRHYYWRQLRDMKGSVDVDAMGPVSLELYARACGFTLGRAHARSGDPIAIASYLGKGEAFEKAIVEFSRDYADQNERDYEAFLAAIENGIIEARPDV